MRTGDNPEKIKIGISACLLGHETRYNGQYKGDPFLVNALLPYFDLISICPEVEMGLSIPREPMRLVKTNPKEPPRLITKMTETDHTDKLEEWINTRLTQIDIDELDGYILKSGSPSCGTGSLDIFDTEGNISEKNGIGFFARALMKRFPSIPVEEDRRLHNDEVRENFIRQVLTKKDKRHINE